MHFRKYYSMTDALFIQAGKALLNEYCYRGYFCPNEINYSDDGSQQLK